MGTKKKALIITDGTKQIRSIALAIKNTLSDYKVKICPAKRFSAEILLPVDFFFIGSKRPKPRSFAYLQEFFAHVNLASRKCAIFSINEKALNYLSGILQDSEADLKDPLLMPDEEVNKDTVEKWLKKVL